MPRLTEKDVLRIFARTGAVLEGHFVLTSGRHAEVYLNKDAVYPHTEETSRLCQAIAEEFAGGGIDVVVAPAVGGVILSQLVAHHLTVLTGHEALGVYTEDGEFKRGYGELVKDKRVLVVDDVLTTGGSLEAVIQTTNMAGGRVTGIAVLCNRGGVAFIGYISVFALTNIPMDSWPEEECPLCAQGVDVNTNVGKGRQFLARKS